MTPERVALPMPAVGGKAFVVDRHGLFVLEEGPTLFRTMSITHAGTGTLEVIDGVPDEHGRFEGDALRAGDAGYYRRNGRRIFVANPVAMGSWMLDGGCYHGLSVLTRGGTAGVPPFATLVWLPVRPSGPAREGPGPAERAVAAARPVPLVPSPRSAMASVALCDRGRWRLADRDCELYSVLIGSLGSWARVTLTNGRGRELFRLPSLVTGSFWLGAFAEGGVVADLYTQSGAAPQVSVHLRHVTA